MTNTHNYIKKQEAHTTGKTPQFSCPMKLKTMLWLLNLCFVFKWHTNHHISNTHLYARTSWTLMCSTVNGKRSTHLWPFVVHLLQPVHTEMCCKIFKNVVFVLRTHTCTVIKLTCGLLYPKNLIANCRTEQMLSRTMNLRILNDISSFLWKPEIFLTKIDATC